MLWLVIILGLFIGSFLNVVILRTHAGRDWVKGRSACPHCGHVLKPIELIPVLSWVIQRGKCRNCGKPISIQYPLVELVTAALFMLLYLGFPIHTYGDLIVELVWFYILGSFIVLTVYDLRWYLLPDKILLPLIIPAAAILISEYITTGSVQVFLGPIEAALAFGGAFYGIAAVSRGRWMGGGDIKLAFVMGLLLGLQKTALAMFLAFNTAAVVGIVLIILGRKKRTSHIPFGPFLMGGTVVAFLYGRPIIDWYLYISGLNLL